MSSSGDKNGIATSFNTARAIWTISIALLKLKHAWKSLHTLVSVYVYIRQLQCSQKPCTPTLGRTFGVFFRRRPL